MKREFREPEIRRIELNLKENIATSPGQGEIMTGVRTTYTENNCDDYLMSTTLSPDRTNLLGQVHNNWGLLLDSGCVDPYNPVLLNMLGES